MSKTAVGLFENPGVADQVVHDLDAMAFPHNEIRVLGEPRAMAASGTMSTPRSEFELGLNREFQTFGASANEANAYVQGVRRGGVLVFATGSNQEVDNAAEIMNRHGAMKIEEFVGREQSLGSTIGSTPAVPGSSSDTGGIRRDDGGTRVFVW